MALARDSESVAHLLLSARVKADSQPAFAQWQTRLQAAALESGGCSSCELWPPSPPDQLDTITILRFVTIDDMRRWRQSAKRLELDTEAAPLVEDGRLLEIAGGAAAAYSPANNVTEVIVTDIKRGKEAEYRHWADRIQKAQAKFPGYRGSFVQPPKPGAQSWTTLLRFDTIDQLQTWLDSAERSALVAQAEPLVDRTTIERVDSSFPGWIPGDPKTGKAPSDLKTALIVLLCLYPLVLLQVRFTLPHLSPFPVGIQTFFINAMNVTLLTWVIMPLAVIAFKKWIYPEGQPRWLGFIFIAIIVALYAFELFLLRPILE